LDELEAGLAITPEDNEALWRVRELDRMSPREYLEWCTFLTRNLPSSRDDLNSPDDEPFTL
jgi:hypothetical protein